MVIGVALLHALATRALGDALAAAPADATPPRIAVAYVRTIEPEAPPPAALARASRPPRMPAAARAAREPAVAASSPPIVDAPRDPADETVAAAAPEADRADTTSTEPRDAGASPVAAGDVLEDAAASMPAQTASGASPAEGSADVVWPASTRVTYVLKGWYRGEVTGHAQVEWVHEGDGRYQVRLDIAAGPEFAPLVVRRMTSAGRIEGDGLVPERYDEDTQVVFRSPRQVRMRFEPHDVVLANGKRVARPAGVQDTASQFIQLSHVFTLDPGRLRTGGSIEIPLALPRSLDTWTYDIGEQETLQTPFGPVETFHLVPRRTSRPNGELTAEVWIAPSLRHLPVRIRIRQGSERGGEGGAERSPDPRAENGADLVIARKPEMAAPPEATASHRQESPRP